jgi:hypothetical protein
MFADDDDIVAMEAKEYLQAKHIPTLFEVCRRHPRCTRVVQGMMTGLIHHRPDDPIGFMEQALYHIKHEPDRQLSWDMFVRNPPARVDEAATSSSMRKSHSANDVDFEAPDTPVKAYVSGYGVLKVACVCNTLIQPAVVID